MQDCVGAIGIVAWKAGACMIFIWFPEEVAYLWCHGMLEAAALVLPAMCLVLHIECAF